MQYNCFCFLITIELYARIDIEYTIVICTIYLFFTVHLFFNDKKEKNNKIFILLFNKFEWHTPIAENPLGLPPMYCIRHKLIRCATAFYYVEKSLIHFFYFLLFFFFKKMSLFGVSFAFWIFFCYNLDFVDEFSHDTGSV